MKATRNRVAATAELAASVEHREHELNGRLLFGGVHRHRDAAAVVDHAHAAILEHVHGDLTRVARERFVNRVINDFVHEVVQAALAGRTDVHAWAFANRLEAFEDRDVRGVVMRCVFLGFAHEGISLMVNAGSVEPGCEDRGPVSHRNPWVRGPFRGPVASQGHLRAAERDSTTLNPQILPHGNPRNGFMRAYRGAVCRSAQPPPPELHRGCGGLGDRSPGFLGLHRANGGLKRSQLPIA